MSLIPFPVKPFKALTIITTQFYVLPVSLPLDPTRFPFST